MSLFRKIKRKIILYFKYPNQLRADINTILNFPKAKWLGISYLPPNYIYIDRFSESSTIIDVGCGFLAEFSCFLIEKYKLTAIGIDPTLKHKSHLQKIEKKYNGRFIHIPAVVARQNESVVFYETLEHESGSLLPQHTNILKDHFRTYSVESMNLTALLKRTDLSQVDLVKLDLEGAEYELLQNCTKEELLPFRQLFIEFHHLAVNNYSKEDTQQIVKRIKNFGYKAFTFDHINYLFYH